MTLTKEEKQKLEDVHDKVNTIHTVLLGTNGDDGLVGEVNRIGKSHFKLKRNFWLLVGVLIGTGILASVPFLSSHIGGG